MAALGHRLHGDYPVGAYLSSGIDSAAVLSSMVRSGARSLKSFTISFEDKLLDESQIAVNAASRLGVEHHLVPVRDSDIAANFLHSIWHSEIPVINCHGTAKFMLSRAAFVFNPITSTFNNYYLRAAEPLSRSLGIDLVPTLVANTAEIERAIEVFASVPNGGLVLPPDVTTTAHRDLIVALAARHHLPAVYTIRPFVTAGGLMSYGVDFTDMFRLAASYVDRILRGDNPTDLPVQAATKFETIVNLKTAKALGLTVPPGLLVAADEVIE
jgi:Asparagine synthase/ABC transporter substrate binding protein